MTPHLETLERFLCLHFARFDVRRRILELINCGHTQPLYRPGGGGPCSLITPGHAPLGVDPRETYRLTTVPIQAGDLFLFYSDGVTDARNPDGEFFGVPRLQRILEEAPPCPPGELVRQVVRAVLDFMGREDPADDLSLVAVAITRV